MNTLDVKGTWANGFRPTHLIITLDGPDRFTLQIIDTRHGPWHIYDAPNKYSGDLIPLNFESSAPEHDLHNIALNPYPSNITNIEFFVP